MSVNEPELTLREYLQPLRDRWWLVVVLVVVIAGGTYAYEHSRPDSYSASTELYFGARLADLAGGSGPTPQSLADAATLLTSSEFAATVAKDIGETGSLVNTVSATPSGDSDLITLATTRADPTSPVRLVNAFARAFVSASTPKLSELKTIVRKGKHVKVRRVKVSAALATAASSIAADYSGVSQLNPATEPTVNRVSAVKYTVLAALVALIGGALLTYLLYRIDPKIKTVPEAEAIYGLPVLAAVLHDPEIRFSLDGRAALSPRSCEAFRGLRLALGTASTPQTILVTSAAPTEGKSTVSRNLALAFAESGVRTVLIDGDFRRPTSAAGFGFPTEPGLSDVVSGHLSLAEASLLLETATVAPGGNQVAPVGAGSPLPGFSVQGLLTILPAGRMPPNPSAAINSAEFRETLDVLRGFCEVLIIDSAPVTAASDTIPLMGHADTVLIVSRTGVTDRRSARLALSLTARVPSAKIAGLVVNDVSHGQAVAYGTRYYGEYFDASTQGSWRPWSRPGR